MMKKKPLLLIIIFAIFLSGAFPPARAQASKKSSLMVFFSPNCHKCAQAKEGLIPRIERELGDRLTIDYRDITDIENYKLLLSLQEKYAPGVKFEVPVFFYEGHFISEDIITGLQKIIDSSLSLTAGVEKLKEVDLAGRLKSFKLLTVAGAGLIDGVNPCAFAVIIFFVSFLALEGYRKKHLLVIGAGFIFSVFVTYILIGLGIFNFFYYLKGFWIAAKVINLSIGIASLVLAGLSIRDIFEFIRSRNTDGFLLKLPEGLKKKIHFVIGAYYRKDSKGLKPRPGLLWLFISALATGFIVSVLEAACTGQVYLPTITFVLKDAALRLKAGAYLLLYNIAFIAPIIVIFILSLLGVSSGQFARFFNKNILLTKILMAVIFILLGIYLIWRG